MIRRGDGADSLRPHGAIVLVKLTEQQIESAALLVASHARDVDDARDLLEMLGLIEPGPALPLRKLTPSGRAQAWRAAQKRLAEGDP